MDRDTSYDAFYSSEEDPAPQQQQAEESNNGDADADDDFDEDSFEDEDDAGDDGKTDLPGETSADDDPRKAADEANISRGPSIDAAGEDDHIDLSDTSAEDGAGQQSSNTARSPAAAQVKELASATPPAAIAAAASKSSPDTGITAQALRARNTHLRAQLKMFSASK
jgi:hypothetical protein